MEGGLSQPVLYETEDRFAKITLNRPEKRNALDAASVVALTQAFERARADEAVRVVVLTGAGKIFSAGADLAALKRLQTATPAENLDDSRQLAALFRVMHDLPKPIIARVNGHAIAGGAGLVAASDLSIASEHAKMGFTEVRIGFVPAIVMYFVLRRVSGSQARDLLLRGHLIGAARAAEIGLINRVVSADELDSEVDALASEIAYETSGSAVALTKELLAKLSSMNVNDALDASARANAEARQTADCRAGIAAFLAKKQPPWRSH